MAVEGSFEIMETLYNQKYVDTFVLLIYFLSAGRIKDLVKHPKHVKSSSATNVTHIKEHDLKKKTDKDVNIQVSSNISRSVIFGKAMYVLLLLKLVESGPADQLCDGQIGCNFQPVYWVTRVENYNKFHSRFCQSLTSGNAIFFITPNTHSCY